MRRYTGNKLKTSDVFAVVTAFQSMRLPLIMAPLCMAAIKSVTVSLKRLRTFLMRPDHFGVGTSSGGAHGDVDTNGNGHGATDDGGGGIPSSNDSSGGGVGGDGVADGVGVVKGDVKSNGDSHATGAKSHTTTATQSVVINHVVPVSLTPSDPDVILEMDGAAFSWRAGQGGSTSKKSVARRSTEVVPNTVSGITFAVRRG